MRKRKALQSTIFDIIPDGHELGKVLAEVSAILDQHPRILDWVAEDFQFRGKKATGAEGISLDTAIRAAVVKQFLNLSYEALAFMIADSETVRAFCRVGERAPCKSTLQGVVGQISAETWEKINRAILVTASAEGVEKGRVVRTDATAVEADIHQPTDSSLLDDAVRVMCRMLEVAKKTCGARIQFTNHTRVAKKRAYTLNFHAKKVDRKPLYKDLLRFTRKTLEAFKEAATVVKELAPDWNWIEVADHYIGLIEGVIDQTTRRVLKGEKVDAKDKVFSLFEEHTDIVVKGNDLRSIKYGHKVNLTMGASGLVLDLVVEDGNPADVTRAVAMIERQVEIYGRAPRQCSFDGAYASKDNLKTIKDLGVKDVAFQKKRGLKEEDMASSKWVYRKLFRFRAGAEAIISCLKRAFGLTRCTWKGEAHFKAYTWVSAVAFNLVTLSRALVKRKAEEAKVFAGT